MKCLTRGLGGRSLSTPARCLAALVSMSVVTLVGQSTTIDFDKDEIGKPPVGFSFALTGQGRPGVWMVKKDDGMRDYRFVVTFDGKTVLDAKDGPFKDAGNVGVWTKADSVIAFDAFAIVPRSSK